MSFDLTVAPTVPLTQGKIVGVTDENSGAMLLFDPAPLGEAIEKAGTALQPEAVGSAAYHDEDDFVSATDHAAALSEIAALQAQVATLTDLIGTGTGGGGMAPDILIVGIQGTPFLGNVLTANVVWVASPKEGLTIQWFLDGEPVAVGQTYTASTLGVVHFVATADNGIGSPAVLASAPVTVTEEEDGTLPAILPAPLGP